MPYSQSIDREHRTCLLFLIDQSDSMADPIAGEPGRSKADRLADAVNRVINEVIGLCTKDTSGVPRNYFDVSVIGYGAWVGPALGGPLAGRDLVPILDVYNNPARIEERRRQVDDGAGGLVTETIRFPVWFGPVANNGTPMCQAMDRAQSVLEPWTRTHPNSFPPMVINITDGEVSDGDPRSSGEALRALATNDGQLLLYNVHLSSHPGLPLLYPESEYGLPDDYARQLFEMSSTLPPLFQQEASREGYRIGPQARGFVFNADIVEVIKLLNIGTRALPLAR